MANQFEAAHRARRVRTMVVYFDIAFARLNVDPIREAKRVADALREMTDEQWRQHSLLAVLRKPPSTETKRDIIATYEARVIESQSQGLVAYARIGGRAN